MNGNAPEVIARLVGKAPIGLLQSAYGLGLPETLAQYELPLTVTGRR